MEVFIFLFSKLKSLLGLTKQVHELFSYSKYMYGNRENTF